MHRMQ